MPSYIKFLYSNDLTHFQNGNQPHYIDWIIYDLYLAIIENATSLAISNSNHAFVAGYSWRNFLYDTFLATLAHPKTWNNFFINNVYIGNGLDTIDPHPHGQRQAPQSPQHNSIHSSRMHHNEPNVPLGTSPVMGLASVLGCHDHSCQGIKVELITLTRSTSKHVKKPELYYISLSLSKTLHIYIL